MKIAISGGSGYIGRNLIQELKKQNVEILLLDRADLYSPDKLKVKLANIHAVIQLAGAPILQRWIQKNKNEILSSRIITTSNIVEAMQLLPAEQRPQIYITASAIGIYSNGKFHDESSKLFSEDFVGQVVTKWEDSSSGMPSTVRKVTFRIGLVVGKGAATIRKLLPLFRLGLGAWLGSGSQPYPFIHISDLIRAFIWAVEKQELEGVYNLVAPEQISNKQFSKELARKLFRPCIFQVPAFLLKVIFGEAAILLLKSPKVVPQRLQDAGFDYLFPDIESALSEIVEKV